MLPFGAVKAVDFDATNGKQIYSVSPQPAKP
jgi:hypothetical protein